MGNTQSHRQPIYTITPSIARHLMDIEAARVAVENTPLSPAVQAELNRKAHIRSTHFSTRIEGNRLTLQEAEEVISNRRRQFHGRERDVAEVQNYWNALIRVEEWAGKLRPVTEDTIRRIHAIVMSGSRAKPLPYRDGQNVVRDSVTGGIIYLPPEAPDVPGLMREMAAWINAAEKNRVPAVIVAALAHYQFVTIHPYYDGNGRTARLLATFILHRGGYGLNGLFSLEEYHARDLGAYYGALAVGGHHNYYMGRADADLTAWLEYFVSTLASVFSAARQEAAGGARNGIPVEPEELRKLDHRARVVIGLFARQETIRSSDVAQALAVSERMARVLLNEWVGAGWLVVADPSKRARCYSLSTEYKRIIRVILSGAKNLAQKSRFFAPLRMTVEDGMAIKTIEELENILSEPTPGVIDTLGRLEGDIMLLGAGGKMGPTLARMARRASDAAGVKRRVIAASIFPYQQDKIGLERAGVETIDCDFFDRAQLNALPDAPNVVFMVGMKFGSSGAEGLTWAINAFLPGLVCMKYRSSRMVIFSSGNVYEFVPADSGGSSETSPIGPVGEYAMSVLGRERVFQHFSGANGIPMSIIRLNYAVELRYGVLTDIARQVYEGRPISVTTGRVNVIWQADANAMTLRAFDRAAVPPFILNVSGPEFVSVREVAEQFGEMMGRKPIFEGNEAPDALLSDGSLGYSLYGRPKVDVKQMMEWIAGWITSGGESLGKPTHFETRDGRF